MASSSKNQGEYKWLLTMGTTKTKRATFASCRSTAVTHLHKVVLLAQKSYTEDAAALAELESDLSKLQMVEGMSEYTYKIGPTRGLIRIEKIGDK